MAFSMHKRVAEIYLSDAFSFTNKKRQPFDQRFFVLPTFPKSQRHNLPYLLSICSNTICDKVNKTKSRHHNEESEDSPKHVLCTLTSPVFT